MHSPAAVQRETGSVYWGWSPCVPGSCAPVLDMYETVDMDKDISEQQISPLCIPQTVKRYSELKLMAGITICKAETHHRKRLVASPLRRGILNNWP